MVCFGLIASNDIIAKNYFDDVKERLKQGHIIKNPFDGCLKIFNNKEKLFIAIDISPVYPPVYWFGLIWIAIIIFVWGFSWWALPGVLLFGIIFFYSRLFFIILIIMGLKKVGYKGKVKLLSDDKTISNLIKWGR